MQTQMNKPTRARCGLNRNVSRKQPLTDMHSITHKCHYLPPLLHCSLTAFTGVGNMDKGADNTLRLAVATPTVSGVLSCPEFLSLSDSASEQSGFGQGALVISRKVKANGMTNLMLSTPCPSYTLDKVKDGSIESRLGDRTMSILWGILARIKTLFLSFEQEDQPVIVAGLIGFVCLFILEVLS